MTQHYQEMAARLREYSKDDAVLLAFINAFARQVALIDAALLQLMEERHLEVAIGAQLDGWGRILEESRQGRDDDEYRAVLLLKIARIYSEGTERDLSSIFTTATNPASVEFSEVFPAGFSLVAIEPDSAFSDAAIVEIIRQAKAAGVGAGYIAHTEGLPAFAFDGDVDADKAGFGDATDPEVGGSFISLY